MPQALLLIDVQNDDFCGGAYTLAIPRNGQRILRGRRRRKGHQVVAALRPHRRDVD